MKVVVAHPGKQHSYYLAEALEKAGMLSCYVTTVYNAEHSLTRIFGQMLKGDNKKRFLTRKNEVFDKKVIRTCEFSGLVYLLLLRTPKLYKFRKSLERRLHDKTYIKAIKVASKNKSDVIILYGGFRPMHKEYIQKQFPNLKCIIDVPSLTNLYVKNMLEEDMKITGNEYIRTEQASTWDESGHETIRFWANNVDGYLVGSSVVQRSLEYLGTEKEKIKIVHYGVDTDLFSQKKYDEDGDDSDIVTFIFVGSVNRRKGIHHLLPAFKSIKDKNTRLMVVGKYDKNDPLIVEYSKEENIKFYGFVTKDVVASLYKEADVFLLPSLGEGMAQVGIEAMSSGLPIICSDYSGVNDVVVDGVNGFVIPVSNQAVIAEKMEWFINNKSEISRMGQKARETALHLTWDNYSQNVVSAVREIIEDNA